MYKPRIKLAIKCVFAVVPFFFVLFIFAVDIQPIEPKVYSFYATLLLVNVYIQIVCVYVKIPRMTRDESSFDCIDRFRIVFLINICLSEHPTVSYLSMC